jgi:hypothetical protein
MATKMTMTSADPAFTPFGVWFKNKVTQFESNGDTASVEQFNNAQAAKVNANIAADASVIEQADGSVIMTNNVQVAEFDVIFNQWVTQYNVQFASEEV